MTILSINEDLTGKVGSLPDVWYITTNDTLATITSIGYFSGAIQQGYDISQTSILNIYYGSLSNQFGIFTVSLVNGIPQINAWVNPGNVTLPVVNDNVPAFNGTTGAIDDSGILSTKLLTSSIVNPDTSIDLVSFDVTVDHTALASGGAVTLITSSDSKQYKIRSLQLNSGGTNFSGGSGDRLGQVTDGTTVYSVIPAATMQALVNAQWGVTDLPNPATASINTSTAAGANLSFKYSGGTTDYTAGSLVITGVAQRIV